MSVPLHGTARCLAFLTVPTLIAAGLLVAPGTARSADDPAASLPVFKSYAVPAGTAPALARALSGLYAPSASRRIEALGDDTVLVYAVPKEQRAIAGRLRGVTEDNPPTAGRPRRPGAAGAVAVRQLVDPQEKNEKRADQKEKEPPPVTITALGNKLIITSDDPEAIRQVQQLVRYLTEAPSSAASFQVIRLKNANAVDAAKVLDEAFNGPRQPAQPQQAPRGFGRFTAPAPAPAPQEVRVRVVADPDTNTLLVRASPLDMVTIRRLLGSAIDINPDDSSSAVHTWVIGPLKYAVATEVATVLQNVYREHTDNNTNLPAVGGGRGGFFRRLLAASAGNQNLGPDGQPRPVTLTIGVDSQTNSVVVACNRALYDDVKGLVDQLEEASRNARRTVEVVPLKNIDPALVQEAIDAIEGRTPTRPATGTTNTATTTSSFGSSRTGSRPITGTFGSPGGFGGPGGFRPGGR